MATVRTARFGATTAQSFDTDRDRGAAGPHEIHQPDDQRIDDHRIRDAAQCLIDSLLALGGAWPGDAGARRSLVAAAVTHGELRRGQGHAEEIIFQDYERLRATVWGHLRRAELPRGRASEAIVGIDAAISLAVAGSLRGYYRDVIARSGEWPVTLERLVWDWHHHAHPQRA